MLHFLNFLQKIFEWRNENFLMIFFIFWKEHHTKKVKLVELLIIRKGGFSGGNLPGNKYKPINIINVLLIFPEKLNNWATSRNDTEFVLHPEQLFFLTWKIFYYKILVIRIKFLKSIRSLQFSFLYQINKKFSTENKYIEDLAKLKKAF